MLARFSLKNLLTPLSRRLLAALVVFELVLTVLHLTIGIERVSVPPFWPRMLNLRTELAFGSIYSSVQLMASGLAAVLMSLLTRGMKGWLRLFWLLLAAVLIYLGLDEYFAIHEMLVVDLGGDTQILIYVIAGILIVAAVLAVYWFALRSQPGPIVGLVVGFASIAFGAIFLDTIVSYIPCEHIFLGINPCIMLPAVEEFFEMAGGSIVLVAFIAHAERTLSEGGWRWAKRILAGGSVLIGLLYAGNIWALPALQARFLAEPVQVEYLDGGLSLVGYHLSEDVLHPGDTLTVRLYWRGSEHLPESYYVSAHLLEHPDIESVGHYDARLGRWRGWHADTWIPGVIMRDTAQIELPADAPTSRSYWLIVRLFQWHGDEAEIDYLNTTDVPITQSSQQVLEPNDVVIASIPALGVASPPEPPTEASYAFADGFTLSGYAMPETAERGASLPLSFWWQADADVERDLTQFIHLRQNDGEAFSGYDQIPFESTFPTFDWPAGMQAVDEVEMPLPDDLPPGEYTLYTGMYVLETGERSPVSGSDGQPVPDFSIPLGTVRVE